MTIKFMTGVAGTLINIYRPDDLKTPIATVDAADDPEDMRGQIRDAVQAAYQIGLDTAKSEPDGETKITTSGVARAYNNGYDAGHRAGRLEGYDAAKSEPLKEDPRVRNAVERAYNEGRRQGREQHAAQLRALLDEGKKKRGPKK